MNSARYRQTYALSFCMRIIPVNNLNDFRNYSVSTVIFSVFWNTYMTVKMQ